MSRHFPSRALTALAPEMHSSGASPFFSGEGVPEKEAVRRANLYAGLSTTGVGTQKSFYDRARFDAEWATRE